jgi:hypothetical protein
VAVDEVGDDLKGGCEGLSDLADGPAQRGQQVLDDRPEGLPDALEVVRVGGQLVEEPGDPVGHVGDEGGEPLRDRRHLRAEVDELAEQLDEAVADRLRDLVRRPEQGIEILAELRRLEQLAQVTGGVAHDPAGALQRRVEGRDQGLGVPEHLDEAGQERVRGGPAQALPDVRPAQQFAHQLVL